MRSASLHKLVAFWQTLTPEMVPSLSDVYTEDAHFRDPFNDVNGIEPIKRIFADMFVRLEQPRYLAHPLRGRWPRSISPQLLGCGRRVIRAVAAGGQLDALPEKTRGLD